MPVVLPGVGGKGWWRDGGTSRDGGDGLKLEGVGVSEGGSDGEGEPNVEGVGVTEGGSGGVEVDEVETEEEYSGVR